MNIRRFIPLLATTLLLTVCANTAIEQQAPQTSQNVPAIVGESEPETTIAESIQSPTANTTESPKTTMTKINTVETTSTLLPKTNPPVSFAPDKISNYPAYIDVLKNNRSILFNERDSDEADYALCDMDADGTPELFILNIPYWNEDNTRLYTLTNGKAVLVKETSGRSWFELTKTGFVHAYGSGGAAYSFKEFYIYRGGTTMELVNEYSAIDEVYKENNSVITESQYWELTAQYGDSFKLNTAPVSKIVTPPTAETKVKKFEGRGTPDSSDGFANLRSSMGYSDNIVFPVYNGTLMYVESTDDPEWYWVNPDNSGYGGGYMKAELVRLFDDLKHVKKPSNLTYLGRGTSTSVDGFLNVHVDASISDGNTVDILPNGAYGDVYSYGDKSWYYIETATGYGYVKANFIQMLKKGELEDLVYSSEFGYVENWDKPKDSLSIQYCDLRGEINTHGKEIASFMTSYVVNKGKKAMLFEKLKHGTKVKAVSYYRSYDVEWYELYDVSDGTDYGWVDAKYIDFYE